MFIGHLPFFGGFSLIASASAWAAPAVQTQASVNDVFSAVFAAPTLCKLLFIHLYLVIRRRVFCGDAQQVFIALKLILEKVVLKLTGIFVF